MNALETPENALFVMTPAKRGQGTFTCYKIASSLPAALRSQLKALRQ